MKNLKLLLTVLAVLFSGQSAMCQEEIEPDAMERLTAQKIAFITDRLQLTPAEAEKFWPVYNEYQGRRNGIAAERRQATREFMEKQSVMTDSEVEKAVDRFVYLHQQEGNLLGEYHARFKAILPVRKVMRLYQAENQYKTFLLRQLRNRGEPPVTRGRRGL